MKTFLTEKHNIPEGATHYWDETLEDFFAWWDDANKLMLTPDGNGVWESVYDKSGNEPTPIPQTKIETPEEKEALDSIDSNPIKPRELSKPVITKVEWGGAGLPAVGSLCKVNRDSYAYRVMYSSKYVVIVQNLDNDNTTAHGMDIVLDLHKGNYTFSKLETEAERVERERLENGQSLYELVQSIWCTVDSKYTPHPYSSPMVDDKTKEMYARLARAVDYRKESE